MVGLTKRGQSLEIKVSDNGNGIDSMVLARLGQEVIDESRGSGTALYNLNRRLQGLYGTSSKLKIVTSSAGSTFSMKIPMKQSKNIEKIAGD